MKEKLVKHKATGDVIASHLRASLHVKYSFSYCSVAIFILRRRLL